MVYYLMTVPATEENFSEEAYLSGNPDVAFDVKNAISLLSGRQHFEVFGKTEGRHIRLPFNLIAEAKLKKHELIRPLLKNDLPYIESKGFVYDYLNPKLKEEFNITDTDAVSSNNYDHHINSLINNFEDGLILDFGAGRRDIYYDNVVNLDVVDYDTTDVRAVGEKLPFIDNVFDAVISLSVLEHVKNPFLCAAEMIRVLKPGGRLICSVPFLQPYHAYPNHYFNMTAEGLKAVFPENIIVDKIQVSETEHPIWALTWILRQYAEGLEGDSKTSFLNLQVSDLIGIGDKYLDKPYVVNLNAQKRTELAYANVLFAHKIFSNNEITKPKT